MPSQYRFDDVEIDLTSYRVLKAGRVLPLEPKTFSVLIFLVRNQGRLVAKRELLDAVWNDAFVTENVLTRAIAQLRKALGDGVKEGRYIETVPTQGYRFIADVHQDETVQKPPSAKAGRSRAVIWTGLGAIVILATGIVAWNLRPKEAESPASDPIPMTTFRGEERRPSFSPDGNQVAFQWDGEKADNWDIYVKVLGSETPLRLTTDPAQDVSPAWSPDGRTIAFVRITSLGKFDLMLIPALGGPERVLGSFAMPDVGTGIGRDVVPTWSADSKSLVVPHSVSGDNEQALFKVSVQTGDASQLTEPGPNLFDSAPQISPDGNTLLFTRSRVIEAGDVYAMALDGSANLLGKPRPIPSGTIKADEAWWAAKGREILLGAPNGLYRMPAEGSDTPKRITWLPPGVGTIAVSPNGNRLAYSVPRGDANIWRIDLTAKAIHPERFIASTYDEEAPEYSPDGKRIAFVSNRGGSPQLWMSDADGGEAHQMTFGGSTKPGSASWSPDGKTLALDSNASGKYQVYSMSAEGGKLTQLTEGPSSNFAATWSRDGRSIYFCSNRTGRNEVWKMPVAGGTPLQLTHNEGVKAIESFDRQTIYFSKDSGGGSIWKMPAQGGPETKLIAPLFFLNFTVVKQGIYFMDRSGENSTGLLKFYSFGNGSTITISTMGSPEFGLDVSPDGRYLAYGELDDMGSNLMLVEDFR